MGIRIKKRLGWGIKVKKKDERINHDAISFLYEEYICIDSFIKWARASKKECEEVLETVNDGSLTGLGLDCHFLYFTEQNAKEEILDFLTLPGEYHEEAFVASPPDSERWTHYRRDDLMDHYEAKESKNKIVDLTHKQGIYPHIGMVRIPGTPERVWNPDEIGDVFFREPERRIAPSTYSQLVGWWSKKEKPIAMGATLEDLLTNYRPEIAESVILLIYYSNILKNFFSDIQSFRPMIYTYWS